MMIKLDVVLRGWHITVLVLRQTNLWLSDFRSNWNLEVLFFCEGRKTGEPDLRGNTESCLYDVRDDLWISSKEDIGTQKRS